MPTTIKGRSTISTSPFNNWTRHAEKCEICGRVQILQKEIISKRMLKVKGAQKGRPKNDVKRSAWIQSFLNFLSSQIKSDDIPTEVKLDDVNNTEMGKANKSVKMRTGILLTLSRSMFLSGKNEEESQFPACKINTFKADISPSSDLQTLLSLLKMQCNRCSKM